MKVCVIGAGAIGSLLAAHLAKVADVSVLTRRDDHAQALNEHGLRVSGRHDFTARVAAVAEPSELPEFDLGIIATKATGVTGAAASLRGRFPGATIMTVQNGLGAEEIVRAQGGWPLVSAVTFMSGTKHSDTHVEYILDTPTWLGPYEGSSYERVQEIAQLLLDAGLEAEALPDLRPAQWSKLVFNATVNGVSALTGLPHDAHFAAEAEPSDLGHLVHDLVDEGKRVAAAAGVELYDDPWEMNVLATQRGSAHYPSMLEDVEARRPTEVELINGALVREAARLRGRGAAADGGLPARGSTRGVVLVRVCVVGCGAVGSLFAATLAQLDDVEVWAYDLYREHVDAINRDGLRLSGAGEALGRPRATSDPGELPACDFGIVATKAMHTSAAIEATAAAFADGCVATVQNGLGNEEAIAKHTERVIRGTTFPAGKLLEPGHVQWDVKGDTTFGPFEPKPAPFEEVARLAEACTRAGMPAQAVEDARGPQWRKVIFNAATNPVGALTRLTHGRVCEDPGLRRLVSGLVDEGKAVAAAQGIVLDADPEDLIDHAAKPEVAYGHKASMLQDVEARRPTEIDYLNGGIVRFGEEHGIPTPLNRAIWSLVKGLEQSW